MTRTRATLFHLAVAVALFSQFTYGQDQDPSEWFKHLCFFVHPFSREVVAHDFSVKLSFRSTPIGGTRIVLVPGDILSGQPNDKRKNVTAETDSSGIAYFFSVPRGGYTISVQGGLLFSGSELKVVENRQPGKEIAVEWPMETIAVRDLNGSLVTGKELNGESRPLVNRLVQLLDLHSGQLLASTFTGTDGSYVFSGLDPGLYALRVAPSHKKHALASNSEVAIELDPNAKDKSIPEMKMLESECYGVQLFRRTKSGEWE